MPNTPTPTAIARFDTMRRIRANANTLPDRAALDTPAACYLAGRRKDAARNGYRGPLTRAELAARAARQASR